MSKVIDLYEFLLEAELHQYYSELKNDLKVSLIANVIYSTDLCAGYFIDKWIIILDCFYFQVMTVPQVKFVTEDDLYQIGMTRPEIRRLKKYFQKYYPQNYFSKFKKVSICCL